MVRSLLLSGVDGDEERQLRLKTNLMAGTIWYTDYSGIDCVREAAELGLAGINMECGWSLREETLTFLRTCDSGALQSEILGKVSHTIDNGMMCHFTNLEDRLGQTADEYIRAALPDDDASAKSKATAHAEIGQWLLQNRRWIFNADAVSYCSVHGRSCKVLPVFDPNTADRHKYEDSHIGKLACMTERELGAKLRINAAGVVCRGWSGEGLGDGEGHTSETPQHLDRRARGGT